VTRMGACGSLMLGDADQTGFSPPLSTTGNPDRETGLRFGLE